MQILRKTEEIIYPASNAHPTLFRLSETDQLRYAAPKLYFYKQGPASSDALKRSLSKTLTFFYPLAGRLVQRTEETAYTCTDLVGGGEEVMGTCGTGISGEEHKGTCRSAMGGKEEKEGTCRVAIGGRMDVSCLDQGALFCEAWADVCLEAYEPDFQPHPDFALLVVFGHDDFLLRVQMTYFVCGAICLCVQAHHCLLDGVASAHFMKSWVEITNGANSPSMCPYISHPPLEVMYKLEEFHSLSMDDYSSYYQPWPSTPVEDISHKIFQFRPAFIDYLKSVASNESCKYTSFECMAAYIWKNLTLARGVALNEEVCLYFPVNGRGKLRPPLPPSYFGNVVFRTHASMKVHDLLEKPLSYTTNLLREATSKVNDVHIRSVLEWSTRQPLPMSSRRCLSPHIFLNPWTSFPLCDYNFGWGKPFCWRVPLIFQEFVMLLPSSLGRGHMDVLIALNKEHMTKLDSLMS